MENLRVILAVVSLLVGITLLVIAGIRTGSKKPGAAGGFVFGGLFLIAALVLWIRGSEPELSSEPPVTEATPDAIADSTASDGFQKSGRNDGSTQGGDSASKTTPQSKESGESTRITRNVDGPHSKQDVFEKRAKPIRKKSPQALTPNMPREFARESTGELGWEDRLYSAISGSFDWIEEFFEKYATPVPAGRGTQPAEEGLAELPEIDFPEIQFAVGTADLTRDSQERLKQLAEMLRRDYPRGHFEIQAYVDSVGPEAFNYVLTQARADAVRDLLISEGIQAKRLTARGYGTGSDPALAESRIQFVARR